jgi:hypothetical protein
VSDTDVDAEHLDDQADREELRTRYYTLLQENRVLLPGVQIMVAFLVTVPFNGRFEDLDRVGDVLWTAALVLGAISIVFLMTPIVFHRVGERRSRSERLVWGIRTQRAGIVALAGSLLLSVLLVTRFVGGTTTAVVVVAAVVMTMSVCWIAVPLRTRP